MGLFGQTNWKYQLVLYKMYFSHAGAWFRTPGLLCLDRLHNDETHNMTSLQWRYNERDDVSYNRQLDCLLNHFFSCRSKKTSKLRITGLCEGYPLVTDGFTHKGPGPCITNVIATCRKNFSQWESSFLWKLRCHWLKFLRRVAKTLVMQGPVTRKNIYIWRRHHDDIKGNRNQILHVCTLPLTAKSPVFSSDKPSAKVE